MVVKKESNASKKEPNIGSAGAARGGGWTALVWSHGHEMVYLGIHTEYLPF